MGESDCDRPPPCAQPRGLSAGPARPWEVPMTLRRTNTQLLPPKSKCPFRNASQEMASATEIKHVCMKMFITVCFIVEEKEEKS